MHGHANMKNAENFVFYNSRQSGSGSQEDTQRNDSGWFVLGVKAA